MKKTMTIDIEPTWKGLVPIMIHIIREGDYKARKNMEEEMMKMAAAADYLRQAQKRGAKMIRVPAEEKLKKVV